MVKLLLPGNFFVIKKKMQVITAVLFLALLNVTSLASAADMSVFASPNHFETGSGSCAIVSADFDRDGKRDIAAANRYSNSISMLISTGTGSYTLEKTYSVAANPAGIVAADFNADGKIDLAVAGASISVLVGNGDGTFQTAENYIAGNAPAAVVVGDFNRDGKPDLAVSNGGSGNISILLGNGDASFQTTVNYAVGNVPSSIAVGDINRDGSPDVVVTNENDNTISLLIGNGNGTFQAAANTDVRSGPRTVVIVDIDHDGKSDLLVTSHGSGWVSHLKGNGDGTFQTILNNGVGNYPTSLATGDFNGDGNIDYIVTRDVSLYNAMIYYGNGKGGILPSGNGLQVENSGTISAVADDLNGDGKTDIMLAYSAGNKIAVATNMTVLEPSGTFLQSSDVYSNIYSETVTAADFNKDGSLDLIVADYNNYSHNISLLSGNGDGTFSAFTSTSADYRSALAVADFNRDGIMDLAVAHGSNNKISVRLGIGEGNFQPAVYYAAGSYCRALLSADFNGDGIADLAVANSGSNDVSILLGKEDGFHATVSYGAGASPFDVNAGDFNQDGSIDLLVANRGSNTISVLMGNGNGTFQAAVPYVTKNAPTAIAVGDFNDDGKLDVAAASSYAAYVSILPGHGDGTFGAHIDYIAANSSLESIAAGDFNRDGKLDLAVTSSSAHELSLLQGNDDGTFVRGQDIVWGSNYIRRLTTGDFDKDGRIDLAVTSDNGVMVFLNVDATPDAFYLYSVNNAGPNTEVTSSLITVSGINTSVPLSITGGLYSVSTDGGLSFGPYSSTTPSSVTKGDVVRVKQTSSPNFSTMTTTTLTISGVSADFQVTTRAANTAPSAFFFVDQVVVTTSSLITSNTITVIGIEAPATVNIVGGEYEVNGNGIWSSASGTIMNNDTVRVRQTSFSSYGTRTDTILSIGGVSDTFSVATQPPDITPEPFSLMNVMNAPLDADVTSDNILVTGINSPTQITVSSGEYEVNGSGTWSNVNGTVNKWDSVRVRLTSSSTYSTTTYAALTVGGVTGTFSVTTIPASAKEAGLFSVTNAMSSPRKNHTATLLSNGTVLIAGGYRGNGYQNSADIYDPLNKTFTATGNMTMDRFNHTATLLQNGKVLIAGGESAGFWNTAEIYDPVTGSFTATVGNVTAARTGHTATLLTDGTVLIVGGYNDLGGFLPTAEIFDPAGGTFAPTVGSMISARAGHTATLLPNGKVLIAGGYGGPSYMSTAEVYDPANRSFTAVAGNMASARDGHTATLLQNGQVLIAGGFNGFAYTSSADVYDPVTSTFTVAAGSMTSARGGHAAILLFCDTVLIIGGNNGSSFLNTAEVYDSETGTFTSTPYMASGRAAHTATLLPNDKVLVAGGYNYDSVLKTAELFDYSCINHAPSSPVLNSPANASEISISTPLLAVNNASDVDHDALHYEFEIDTANTFDTVNKQTSGLVAEGAGTTGWTPAQLKENTTYYWRAKAHDGRAAGPWMPTAIFFVNTISEAPSIPPLNNPPDDGQKHTGDVSGDGVVDVVDALAVLQIVAGLTTASTTDLTHADVAPLVNGRPQPDGKITIGDVVVILRNAVGLQTW